MTIVSYMCRVVATNVFSFVSEEFRDFYNLMTALIIKLYVIAHKLHKVTL